MIIFRHQLTGVFPLDTPQVHTTPGKLTFTGLPDYLIHLDTYLPLPVLSIMSKDTAC